MYYIHTRARTRTVKSFPSLSSLSFHIMFPDLVVLGNLKEKFLQFSFECSSVQPTPLPSFSSFPSPHRMHRISSHRTAPHGDVRWPITMNYDDDITHGTIEREGLCTPFHDNFTYSSSGRRRSCDGRPIITNVNAPIESNPIHDLGYRSSFTFLGYSQHWPFWHGTRSTPHWHARPLLFNNLL